MSSAAAAVAVAANAAYTYPPPPPVPLRRPPPSQLPAPAAPPWTLFMDCPTRVSYGGNIFGAKRGEFGFDVQVEADPGPGFEELSRSSKLHEVNLLSRMELKVQLMCGDEDMGQPAPESQSRGQVGGGGGGSGGSGAAAKAKDKGFKQRYRVVAQPTWHENLAVFKLRILAISHHHDGKPFVVKAQLFWRGGMSNVASSQPIFVLSKPADKTTITTVAYSPQDTVGQLKANLYAALPPPHTGANGGGSQGGVASSCLVSPATASAATASAAKASVPNVTMGVSETGGTKTVEVKRKFRQPSVLPGLQQLSNGFHGDRSLAEHTLHSFQSWTRVLSTSGGSSVQCAGNAVHLHELKKVSDSSWRFMVQVPDGTIHYVVPPNGNVGKNTYDCQFMKVKKESERKDGGKAGGSASSNGSFAALAPIVSQGWGRSLLGEAVLSAAERSSASPTFTAHNGTHTGAHHPAAAAAFHSPATPSSAGLPRARDMWSESRQSPSLVGRTLSGTHSSGAQAADRFRAQHVARSASERGSGDQGSAKRRRSLSSSHGALLEERKGRQRPSLYADGGSAAKSSDASSMMGSSRELELSLQLDSVREELTAQNEIFVEFRHTLEALVRDVKCLKLEKQITSQTSHVKFATVNRRLAAYECMVQGQHPQRSSTSKSGLGGKSSASGKKHEVSSGGSRLGDSRADSSGSRNSSSTSIGGRLVSSGSSGSNASRKSMAQSSSASSNISGRSTRILNGGNSSGSSKSTDRSTSGLGGVSEEAPTAAEGHHSFHLSPMAPVSRRVDGRALSNSSDAILGAANYTHPSASATPPMLAFSSTSHHRAGSNGTNRSSSSTRLGGRLVSSSSSNRSNGSSTGSNGARSEIGMRCNAAAGWHMRQAQHQQCGGTVSGIPNNAVAAAGGGVPPVAAIFEPRNEVPRAQGGVPTSAVADVSLAASVPTEMAAGGGACMMYGWGSGGGGGGGGNNSFSKSTDTDVNEGLLASVAGHPPVLGYPLYTLKRDIDPELPPQQPPL